MSCNNYTISGQILPCKDRAGIDSIYLIDYQYLTSFGLSGDTISISAITFTVGQKFKTYNIPTEGGSFVSTPTISKENNTAYYDNQLTLPLYGFSTTTKLEIHALMLGKFVAMWKSGDVYNIFGLDTPIEMLSGPINTGKAYADRTAGDIILSNKTIKPVYTIPSAIATTLIS
jgi:hypothetical protein